ncbi:MAG: ABC transporter ATP-binding protein [Gemmatimonadota bacterium]|nr:MAG: ABC transporter ATP-binding protein [Gemmatimonadota bacterium]
MTPAAPAVRIDAVTVFYGEVVGLSQVSLELSPGIVGIVGPNGSGKTTLMRVLVGLLQPREGHVQVLGGSPFADAEVRAQITLVPASENFYPNLSGRKNLEVAFLAQGLPRAEARARAELGLERIGLVADGPRHYGTWSRGMRQRLKLGLALANDSPVVLLDEPFLGVDPPNRHALREHILALGNAGKVVLVSSHILHEIEALTDRVGVLANGRLLGFGRLDQLLSELRDDHPHRIRLRVDAPRPLAVELLSLEHVRELRILGEDSLEFTTVKPDEAYRDLPAVVVRTGAVVRDVRSDDHSLENVFREVTASGSRRL